MVYTQTSVQSSMKWWKMDKTVALETNKKKKNLIKSNTRRPFAHLLMPNRKTKQMQAINNMYIMSSALSTSQSSFGWRYRLSFISASWQMELSSLWEREALSAALLRWCVCEEQVWLHFKLRWTKHSWLRFAHMSKLAGNQILTEWE